MVSTSPLDAILARQRGVLAILRRVVRARAALLAREWKMEGGRALLLGQVPQSLDGKMKRILSLPNLIN